MVFNNITFNYDIEDDVYYASDNGYRFFYNNYAHWSVYYGGFDKKIGVSKTQDGIGDIILKYERIQKLIKLKNNINERILDK